MPVEKCVKHNVLKVSTGIDYKCVKCMEEVAPTECEWKPILGGGESFQYLIREGDQKVYGVRHI